MTKHSPSNSRSVRLALSAFVGFALLIRPPSTSAQPAVPQPDVQGCATPALLIGQEADIMNPNPTSDTISLVDSITITDLQIDVELTHSWIGDVVIDLTSPAGTQIRLHDGTGASADDLDAVFWDGGAPHAAPFDCGGCVMQPAGPGQTSDFGGEDSFGDWTLTIEDTYSAADDGTLDAWCVNAFDNALPPAATDLVCEAEASGALELSWSNPAAYDAIEVSIDTVVVQTLAGDATSFTTMPLSSPAMVSACVHGWISGQPSPAACCSAAVAIAPPEGMTCSPSALDIATVDWSNPTPYDSIEVRVNGALEATLAGAATSYSTDPEALPAMLDICVRGISAVGQSVDTCCLATLTIAPITNLNCTVLGSTAVALSWDNPIAYDAIDIVVNGSVEATLVGSDTTYTVILAPGTASASVAVVGELIGIGSTLPVSCDVALPIDATGQIVIYRGERPGGEIDSVAAIAAAADANGLPFQIVGDLASVSGTPSAVLCAMGTYPDNRHLTGEDGARLVDYVLASVPVYVEGADVWGFDQPTSFGDYDGIDASLVEDGDDSLVTLSALPNPHVAIGGWSASYAQDQLGSDWTDRLTTTDDDLAGSDSTSIWQAAVLGYDVGTFYSTDPPYGSVLCQSWEFGGYGGDRVALLAEYLEALIQIAPGPTFRRGDVNADGEFDISDAVFMLAALFTAGAPSTGCDDAADVNDDGVVDISDAIYALGALFTVGSPAPPAPGPAACGPDPTPDPLDCPSRSGC